MSQARRPTWITWYYVDDFRAIRFEGKLSFLPDFTAFGPDGRNSLPCINLEDVTNMSCLMVCRPRTGTWDTHYAHFD